MRKKTDNKLLDDVLAESAHAPDFREALLGETLRLVRRRRRFRQAWNVVMVLAALGLLWILVWPKSRTPIVMTPAVTKPIEKAVQKSYALIDTQPLSVGSMITTHPLAPMLVVATAATVEIVQTATGNYRTIGDEELLALVAAHPAVLVRTGPHSEMLVFANPKDAKGFPLN